MKRNLWPARDSVKDYFPLPKEIFSLGLSRATIFMMLKRLIAKGAVTMDDSGKFQTYSASVAYADVEPEETESFLSKVYGGSVGMMVSNLVDRGALSEQEIQELKAILDAAEKEHAQ